MAHSRSAQGSLDFPSVCWFPVKRSPPWRFQTGKRRKHCGKLHVLAEIPQDIDYTTLGREFDFRKPTGCLTWMSQGVSCCHHVGLPLKTNQPKDWKGAAAFMDSRPEINPKLHLLQDPSVNSSCSFGTELAKSQTETNHS